MDNVDSGNGAQTGSWAVFANSQGSNFSATVVRVTRYLVALEIYGSGLDLRMSEVLSDFQILIDGRTVYSGRAVICSLVNAGSLLICEANLEDSWLDVNLFLPIDNPAKLRNGFDSFLSAWQKIYRILPEYKVAVADLQSFLMDMRLWLDQVELGIRSSPVESRMALEQDIARELGKSTTPALTHLFAQVEKVTPGIDEDLRAAHRAYTKRMLHPLLLCAPFLYRTYHKPLGYAGDYEMVNMITRSPLEGGSLFAKIVNLWFLQQPPAEAHRNRITYLTDKIKEISLARLGSQNPVRMLSLGCGPSVEIQNYIREHPLADRVHFTLIDFNEETLTHAQATLDSIKQRHNRRTSLLFQRKSVQQILKQAGRHIDQGGENRYDFVYCAGLFDYLSDQMCQRLTDILYGWVVPGGLLVTTNVDTSNPRRHTMDDVMEWHLNYRSGNQLAALRPGAVNPDDCHIFADETGVNVYLESRKPADG